MYWPNEPVNQPAIHNQIGLRNGFDRLLAERRIRAVDIYPYLQHRHDHQGSFTEHALSRVQAFNPDVLFVQHVAGAHLPSELWQSVRQTAPNTLIVYHDEDAFSRYRKPFDRDMLSVLDVSDLVLTNGFGDMLKMFRRYTRGIVRYTPSCFDVARFRTRDVRQAEKQYDLTMIANRGRGRRIKFLYQPGGAQRVRLARAASMEFGERFALYGSGWEDLPHSARGRLPFLDQESALQKSRVSINWDNYTHLPYYYSDRLPISLAAGVPHVTSYHTGFEQIFQGCEGLYTCKTWPEVIDCSRWLLSKTDQQLLDIGLKAQSWVSLNLDAYTMLLGTIELAGRLAQQSNTRTK
jgi:hypothetical protein